MFARVPAAWPNLRATEFSRGSCCVDFLAIEPPIAPPVCKLSPAKNESRHSAGTAS